MARAVFLDRDNTIVRNDGDLGDPDGVQLMQGAASAIASLRGLGYKIVVVSNQGGVARGTFSEQDVDAVNQRIAEQVRRISGGRIDRFYYCPYHPEGTVPEYRRDHPWRKPQPGMIRQAADDLDLDLPACWTVGDQPRDIEAGHAAGTRTILLSASPAEQPDGEAEPGCVAGNLVEAVRIIAQQRRPEPAAVATEPAHPPQPADHERPAQTDEPETEPEPEPSVPEQPTDRRDTPLEADAETAPETAGPEQTQPAEPQPPGEPADSPPQEPQPEPAPVAAEEAAPESAAAREPKSEPAPSTASHHEPVPSDAPPEPAAAGPDAPRTEQLLQQVLRELKAQRAGQGEFSLMKMLAGAVQMIVLGLVLFGLLAGGGPASFLQWMAGAVLGQLIVLTLLLVNWQR